MCESLQQFLFAGSLGLSPSISWQFSLLQPKIATKSLKTPIFRVQGHSRSSMLTFLRSSSPVLVMISSRSVPLCNLVLERYQNVTPRQTDTKTESRTELPQLIHAIALARKTRGCGRCGVACYAAVLAVEYVLDQGSQTRVPRAACGPRRRHLRPVTHYLKF